MNIIIWLIAGAAVGYVASLIMKTNGRQGLGLDIVVGVVGAFIAGYFLTPLISHFAGWPTAFTAWSAVLGLAVSASLNAPLEGRVQGHGTFRM